MNAIIKTAFIAVFLTFFTSGIFLGHLSADDVSIDNANWKRSSGDWKVQKSYLTEVRGWIGPWGYYELMDHNTVISQSEFENFQKIEFTLEMSKPQKSKFDATISFGVRSPEKSWYYYSYGVRFHGEKKTFSADKFNKVSLVQTSMIDAKLPPNQKGNNKVTEIASAKCDIPADKESNYTLLFEGDTLKVLREKTIILETKVNKSEQKGRMAISGRNASLKLKYFKVIGPNEKVIFADNFEKDTIYRAKVEATIK
jgi:hypothetical protein